MNNELWQVKNFRAEDIFIRLIKTKTFKVPKYQRTLVWTEKQKETFIDSIKKGYPFGSLLLYDDQYKDEYLVIDGLQRSRTICEFIQNPTKFFDRNDVDSKYLEKIYDLSSDFIENKYKFLEEVADILETWLKKDYKTMKDVKSMQFIDYAYEISNKFPSFKSKEREIVNIIKPSLIKYKEKCNDLCNAKVPAIIIGERNENKLPEIFDRINSKGTQLSRYQIYAAKWTLSRFKLDDSKLSDEILDFIKKMYSERAKQGYKIYEYDAMELDKKRVVNFYDLLFGFGQMVSKNFPYLYNSNISPDTVVSSAFTLFNSCLGYKSSELDNLLENYRKKLKEDEINLFLSAIYEAIRFVDIKILKAVTRFKFNKRTAVSIIHSENQINSMIASIFIAKHGEISSSTNLNKETQVINLNLRKQNKNWKQKEKQFKKNMIKFYVSDIMSSKWKGSGDSFLYQILYNQDRYLREMDWEEFENNFDSFVTKINSERNEQSKVAGPKKIEKLILKTIYLDKFTAFDQLNNSKYDIEHLATKKIMVTKCKKFDISLPISSIGNLCLLPEYENRTKKDKILYDDSNYVDSIGQAILKTIEEKYTFTEKNDFDFLLEKEKENFIEGYYKFLNNRVSKMKIHVKNNIFKNS